MLLTAPAVFAVGKMYQIMMIVENDAFVWVRVGDKEYYDEENGVMRSMSETHRVSVPMSELDAVGRYTVCIRRIIDRKPYFTETAPTREYHFAFRPVPENGSRAYHIADAHGRVEEPIAAAKAFGDIDWLILNGDLLNHSDDPTQFRRAFDIAARLTGGHIPIVYARGNHDLRGRFAELRATYAPAADGKPFYTFRLGSLWGVVLDCAEDKPDEHEEYGGSVRCRAFRERQTAFLKEIIARKKQEYDARGVTVRLVISHNPFTRVKHPPFDIETDIYAQWARLLKDHIHPDLMICGHVHLTAVHAVGGDFDHLGQPCPVVTASKPEEGGFVGGGFVFGDDGIQVTFTDHRGQTLLRQIV